MKNTRIFISGGSGVIGRELIKKLLTLNNKILTGDLVALPEKLKKKVIFVKGDLNKIKEDYIKKFKPAVFIHLAAKFERVTESEKHWDVNFWNNIKLSHHLMSIIKNTPSIKKIINASSYLIYDKKLYTDRLRKIPYTLSEKDPVQPRNLTGGSKLLSEIELEFLKKIKKKKITTISARIFRGYGKGSKDVISGWIRSALKNKTINAYNIENSFDYINSEDTAEGLIKLCSSKNSGVFNLGFGKSISISTILKILRKYLPNIKIKYSKNNEYFENSKANIKKIKAQTGWKPKVKIDQGIKQIILYEKNKK